MSRRARPQLSSEAVALDITADAEAGWGAAEWDGQRVRVKGALAGERHLLQLLRAQGRDVLARSVGIERAVAERAMPECEHFALCGGCSWQHLTEEARLALQMAEVAALLAQAGVAAPTPSSPVRGPQYHYRRRARLSARYTQRGARMFLGFKEAASRQIADISTCVILVEPFASALPELRELLGGLSIRHAIPQLEFAAGDDGAVVVVRALDTPTRDDLRQLRDWTERSGIVLWLQPGGPATAAPLQANAPLRLHYRAGGGPALAFHPLDFVQINAVINAQLVGAVRALVAAAGARRVLDLFCGIGNFALPLAADGCEAVGVEGVPDLVVRARDNAERLGLGQARFLAQDLHAGGAAQLAGKFAAGYFDAAVLDPPRTGLGAVGEALPGLAIPLLIYVSCNPVSFAADAAGLARAGYRLREWRVLDMFPHTRHVECMAVFDLLADVA